MTLIINNTPVLERGNHPAPAINPRIQETLTKIGGLVPEIGGPYAGMPVYRLAWGQHEKHFEQGKFRIRFVDDDQEPIIVQERFFVAPDVFTRCSEWLLNREQDLRNRFLNFDFNVFAETALLSSYLREKESSLNYMELTEARGTREELEMDYLGIASSSAPADWIYLTDVKEVIEIGKPFWYVMKWISAQKHGGREHWEKSRYAHNAYVPELNDVLPIVDQKGPFPEYGFWIPRLEIADYPIVFGKPTIHGATTTEPTEENCIEPILEMEFEMKTRNLSPIGREQFYKDRESAFYAEQQKFEKGVSNWVHELLEVKAPDLEN